jgi:starch synthase
LFVLCNQPILYNEIMNILFAVWELDPFFKIGGLGDVARSLPTALIEKGIDIRLVLPYYKVTKLGSIKQNPIGSCTIEFDGKKEPVEIFSVIHPTSNAIVYYLKNQTYLDIVKSPDTWAFFAKALVAILKENLLDFKPDIIHGNDVHCGFIPLLVKMEQLPIKTIITIHNIVYQGRFTDEIYAKLGIDKSIINKLTTWELQSDRLSLLMEGILHADVVSTVSPTYAKEIMTTEYGAGLADILKGREGRVFGILNGIDINHKHIIHQTAVPFPFSPQERVDDPNIKYYDWKEGKKLCKEFLQKKLGLAVRNDVPLICFIGRFDSYQKGLPLLHALLNKLDLQQYQFAVLGSGEPAWEDRFAWLGTFHPESISCTFKFDDALAHQIYAGSDFIIIPSRYEPCGLIQMIAMLFGTLPIAHDVGGLHDSIKNGENGFLFTKYESGSLENTFKKAVELYHHDKNKLDQMIQNALITDFSWGKNAEQYIDLYRKLNENSL